MRPTLRDLARILVIVADVLDADRADYCFGGRFRFALDGDWSLVVSPDDAGRLRLDCCFQSRVAASLWCPIEDTARLRRLVSGALQEAAALAA